MFCFLFQTSTICELKFACSVENADVSVCVLPLPDILNSNTKEITIPSSVRHLIGKNTFFLLNKADLAVPLNLKGALIHASESFGIHMLDRTWTTSITTGAGVREFVDGLSLALKSE